MPLTLLLVIFGLVNIYLALRRRLSLRLRWQRGSNIFLRCRLGRLICGRLFRNTVILVFILPLGWGRLIRSAVFLREYKLEFLCIRTSSQCRYSHPVFQKT